MTFYIRINGGKAVAKELGVVANSVTGFARGGTPKDWAHDFRGLRQ